MFPLGEISEAIIVPQTPGNAWMTHTSQAEQKLINSVQP